MEPELINTKEKLKRSMDSLPYWKELCPEMYIDFKGNNLSRNGTLSLITILSEPPKTVHIVDVTILGRNAFLQTGAESCRFLKAILESQTTTKACFDVRDASDALYSMYKVSLAGIEDLQLFEMVSRRTSKDMLYDLNTCILHQAKISDEEKQRWSDIRKRGRGSYDDYDKRPLSADIKQYCAQSVLLLPGLRDLYLKRLCDASWAKLVLETRARIDLSRTASYNGEEYYKSKALRAWKDWDPTPEERESGKLLEGRQRPAPPSIPGKRAASTSPSVLQPTVKPSPPNLTNLKKVAVSTPSSTLPPSTKPSPAASTKPKKVATPTPSSAPPPWAKTPPPTFPTPEKVTAPTTSYDPWANPFPPAFANPERVAAPTPSYVPPPWMEPPVPTFPGPERVAAPTLPYAPPAPYVPPSWMSSAPPTWTAVPTWPVPPSLTESYPSTFTYPDVASFGQPTDTVSTSSRVRFRDYDADEDIIVDLTERNKDCRYCGRVCVDPTHRRRP